MSEFPKIVVATFSARKGGFSDRASVEGFLGLFSLSQMTQSQ